MLFSVELGRICRETVLHNVVTKPLGYPNSLTSSSELEKNVIRGWESAGKGINCDYRDSVCSSSAKYVSG